MVAATAALTHFLLLIHQSNRRWEDLIPSEKMVEAAGIEPASKTVALQSPRASPQFLLSAAISPGVG